MHSYSHKMQYIQTQGIWLRKAEYCTTLHSYSFYILSLVQFGENALHCIEMSVVVKWFKKAAAQTPNWETRPAPSLKMKNRRYGAPSPSSLCTVNLSWRTIIIVVKLPWRRLTIIVIILPSNCWEQRRGKKNRRFDRSSDGERGFITDVETGFASPTTG